MKEHNGVLQFNLTNTTNKVEGALSHAVGMEASAVQDKGDLYRLTREFKNAEKDHLVEKEKLRNRIELLKAKQGALSKRAFDAECQLKSHKKRHNESSVEDISDAVSNLNASDIATIRTALTRRMKDIKQ